METTNIKSTGYANYSIAERNAVNSSGTGSRTAVNNSGVIYERSSSIESYGLYSSSGVSTQKLSNNYQIQTALHSLGFYSGPTDGNLSSEKSKRAIENFQKVYGLYECGKMNGATKKKLTSAYTMKCDIMQSTAISNIDKEIDKYTFDYAQRDTFANTWTFLRVGMGLKKSQAAGVCGNIIAESVFSADNAQDGFGYLGVHNKEYKYSVTDEIGYGLIQWAEKSRKEGLLKTAKEMGLSVSNLNAQLAWFRKEMETNKQYTSGWKEICNAKKAREASDIFLEKIEEAGKRNYADRRKYSRIIFYKMKKF